MLAVGRSSRRAGQRREPRGRRIDVQFLAFGRRPVEHSKRLRRRRASAPRSHIYIGAAPGVGKTYQILEDAHHLKKQGVDIVIGFIEPHGRAETEARLTMRLLASPVFASARRYRIIFCGAPMKW